MKKPALQRRAFYPEEIASTEAQRLDSFDVFRGQARRPVWAEWSCVLSPSPQDYELSLEMLLFLYTCLIFDRSQTDIFKRQPILDVWLWGRKQLPWGWGKRININCSWHTMSSWMLTDSCYTCRFFMLLLFLCVFVHGKPYGEGRPGVPQPHW